MEFLSILQLPFTTIVFYALPFLVALMVIVFVHEYGHYKVARLCGVNIEAFSIGFGKEITGWYDKHGTRWKLCWIPLGGYVKFEGDANAASKPDAAQAEAARTPGNFHGKPVWQRAAVVVAGPLANFVLAILIFAAAFALVGVPVTEPRIDEILSGSAAEKAGLRPGDVFVSVDGSDIETFSDLQQAIFTRPGEAVTVVVNRGGEIITMTVVPDLREEPDNFGGKMRIGLLGVKHNPDADQKFERYGPLKSLEKGTERTWFIVNTTFRYLGKLIRGNEKADQLGGPIAMAKAAGDAASIGIFSFISVIAFLSVSIGLINLFPIPMLDGGHLVYYGIEAVRGKPLGPDAQEWGYRIGLSLVVMLMLVGTWNDVVRLISMALGGT
jgi:regulator of sigma E protease